MQFKLLDTGYVSNETLTDQTQLSDGVRAGRNNGGTAVSALTLNTTTLSLSGDTRTESKPTVDVLRESRTSTVSSTNRIISVDMNYNKVLNTTDYQYSDIYQLFYMERTRSLKLLYPTVTTDTKKTLVEVFGAQNVGGNFSSASPSEDAGTVSTTTPYLLGRVKNMRMSDNANTSRWTISFDFELTKND